MDHDRISCGLDFSACVDLTATIEECRANRFDFACVPLYHPRFKQDLVENEVTRQGPTTRSDMTLPSSDWSSLVVGKTSPWLQLESDNVFIRRNSEKMFQRELDWATHLTLPCVIITISQYNNSNMTRNIYQHTLGINNLQFWICVPLVAPKLVDDPVVMVNGSGDGEFEPSTTSLTSWHWWDRLRTQSNRSKKLSLVLRLTSDLPSDLELARWFGEPIKACLIPTDVFLVNKKGFPVLSMAHQNVIRRLFKMDIQLILTGAALHENGYVTYQQYFEHLWQTRPPIDTYTAFSKGYEDFLQCPLQPLMDNLESQTYETFEKDPIKYSQYEKAVYQALLDRVGEEDGESVTTTLMVVGAGRGPIVTASLAAAKRANRKLRVYAVEKNPNAVITLDNLVKSHWVGSDVTVIASDMREWAAPVQADILVSELLGSFSDNELSPECLDGAQEFLKPDGIMIPQVYTSWLAPLFAPKIHSDISNTRDKDKHPDTCFEMPYVVRLHTCHLLDEPKPVFTFRHPTKKPTDNERHITMSFKSNCDAVVHGFAGYFDTILYGDVTLSIVPATHSEGMISWFPIFFPLKTPVHISQGQQIEMEMWRRVSSKKVWYEWGQNEPYPTPIHNPGGRSYFIGL